MIHSTTTHPGRHWPTPAAALVVLIALLLGACSPVPTPSSSVPPSLSPSNSAGPSASSTPSAAGSPAACASANIQATGGPWGGAAGSRGSDIVVDNRGVAACLLPAGATIALVDQRGTVLVSNTPARVGTGPEIAPNGRMGFSLVFGNWCDQPLNLPLHFQLALASAVVEIQGLSVSTRDDLPPCNGPGQPAALSTTDWEPR